MYARDSRPIGRKGPAIPPSRVLRITLRSVGLPARRTRRRSPCRAAFSLPAAWQGIGTRGRALCAASSRAFGPRSSPRFSGCQSLPADAPAHPTRSSWASRCPAAASRTFSSAELSRWRRHPRWWKHRTSLTSECRSAFVALWRRHRLQGCEAWLLLACSTRVLIPLLARLAFRALFGAAPRPDCEVISSQLFAQPRNRFVQLPQNRSGLREIFFAPHVLQDLRALGRLG